MPVTRREALRQFLFVSTGVALLPSCLQHPSKASIVLKKISVDANGENMLAELTDTLIPATTTPGAKDVSAHLFVLTMVDDCYTKEDQQKWLRGMQQFEELAQQKNGHSFLRSTPAEREALLTSLETKKEDDLSFFYHSVKRWTIRAYTSSKYYLTKVQVYELVPARFKGCVPVSPVNKKIA